jgi:L-ascorbate metabolism protein UlaG (beta-lactamase superfamily)
MKLLYVGHSSVIIEDRIRIIIDPYLKGEGREGISRYNPNAFLSVEDVHPDLILVTHGHGDHFGQTLELMEEKSVRLVASKQVCDYVADRLGEDRVIRIEPGELVSFDEVYVEAVEAEHKHGLEGLFGDIIGALLYRRFLRCGTNLGYLVKIDSYRIYHSGDTYKVPDIGAVDVALLGMDGFRTMNKDEAVEVILKMKPSFVVPIHYRFFDKGKEIVEKVKEAVNDMRGETIFRELEYGEWLEI